jgi:hypothetical protein
VSAPARGHAVRVPLDIVLLGHRVKAQLALEFEPLRLAAVLVAKLLEISFIPETRRLIVDRHSRWCSTRSLKAR